MTDAVQERVLLVEDDDSLRQLLVEELEDRGLQVRALASAEEAVGSLESWEPALVVSDLRLPGADGMALLRRVKSMQAAPAFLVITAFGSIQQAVAALRKAPTNFSPSRWTSSTSLWRSAVRWRRGACATKCGVFSSCSAMIASTACSAAAG